jgi:hypothetical protein
MNTLLQNDRAKRPDLFHFLGPIQSLELDAWLSERQLAVPNDLKEFWSEAGGGELFESETILSPFGRSDLGDDVETVNQFHKQKGMPADWIVFHTGIGGLTVVQIPSGKYASVREGLYEVQQTFASFADWYANLIRREYASRYNLPDR